MDFKGKCRYTEVLYFFAIHKGNLQHILAAVKMFSLPDPDILIESYQMLYVCKSSEGVEVVNTKSLTDVVGMIPFHRYGEQRGGLNQGKFFLIEKMSLTSIQLSEDDDTTVEP